MANIPTTSLAQQFLNFAQPLLKSQMQITARQLDYVTAANQNAQSLVAAAAITSNQYFYDLAGKQTFYMNSLGNQYADIAKRASKKMGRGGMLGFLGF